MEKFRFSEESIVLPCRSNYDPTLHKQVRVPKSAEIKQSDGSWKPYPIVRWVDNDYLLCTEVEVIRKDGVYKMASANGVPDATLYLAAEKAGLYVEG